ncbi:MAG: sigma-70 family RNA polymerase sigma factor, partial [Candidatus Zixiibacteriota bacterium]
QIINGFLAGEKNATRQISGFIDAVLHFWRENFGSDAEDIKADVLYKLLVSLRKDEIRDKSKLQPFIGTIVKRTCLEYRRFNERFAWEELDKESLPDKALSPEQELEKNQLAKLNYRIIRRIGKECQELWRMYLKNGLNYAQIAENLDLAVGTIKWKFSKCRDKAHEIIKNIGKSGQPF